MADGHEPECGTPHFSIVDAMRHAEDNRGCRNMPLQPYWGTTPQNLGYVVGFQFSSRKRWRLDYGLKKGIHINEENFDNVLSPRKVVHRVSGVGELTGDLRVRLQWQKWISAALDIPKKVKEEIELLRRTRRK